MNWSVVAGLETTVNVPLNTFEVNARIHSTTSDSPMLANPRHKPMIDWKTQFTQRNTTTACVSPDNTSERTTTAGALEANTKRETRAPTKPNTLVVVPIPIPGAPGVGSSLKGSHKGDNLMFGKESRKRRKVSPKLKKSPLLVPLTARTPWLHCSIASTTRGEAMGGNLATTNIDNR
jgi:hypothetical protein